MDQSKLWLNGNVGFGHKMNFFTPESFHEELPFFDSTRKIAITADTRIDNRDDVARHLGIRLANDHQTTDSQLILLAYEKRGVAFASYLIGDFSIVIWDENKNQLVLATDHFGHQPIYYHFEKGQFIFASEIKPLTALIQKGPNPNKICDLLLLENFYGNKESTYLKDISRVEPATTMVVNDNGIEKHVYWRPDPTKRLPYKKESDLVEAFQEDMFRAVGDRIRTDLPVASMLSGGLDSSAITAVASHILKNQNKELIAIAGVIPESSKPMFTDEREYIDEFKSFENVRIEYMTAEGLGPMSGVAEKLRRTLLPNFSNRHFMYDA
ncbi:asparagine synthase-related protein, partial [Acaryochloris thomasi]|uniref:asparagine synthase-related protein n=1 Tax=Acaryochloris thomasi TaxID=2929456 RepID=UPI0018F1D6C0